MKRFMFIQMTEVGSFFRMIKEEKLILWIQDDSHDFMKHS